MIFNDMSLGSESELVSIPQAVGTIAIEESDVVSAAQIMFQYRKR